MQTMILQTISGNKPTSPKAKVLNYGKVWFDIEGRANIFSFAKMEVKYCINYDSTLESGFNLHTENGIINVCRSEYKTGTIMVQTDEDNKSFFADHQVS